MQRFDLAIHQEIADIMRRASGQTRDINEHISSLFNLAAQEIETLCDLCRVQETAAIDLERIGRELVNSIKGPSAE